MRGFTLIELMIVLAIMGILASIAWPGYQNVVHRTRRVDARLALLRIQYLQERHYAIHNRYAASLTDTSANSGLGTSNRSDAGDYALTLNVGLDGQHYVTTAQAAAAGRQLRDQACQWLSIDDTSQRRAADISGTWTVNDPNQCWG
jgi:type IV pilus assembly protein PilE